MQPARPLPAMIESKAEAQSETGNSQKSMTDTNTSNMKEEIKPIEQLTKPVIVSAGINNNDVEVLKSPIESKKRENMNLCGGKNCKTENPILQTCSACNSIRYCSVYCQQNDWPS